MQINYDKTFYKLEDNKIVNIKTNELVSDYSDVLTLVTIYENNQSNNIVIELYNCDEESYELIIADNISIEF